RQNRSAHLSYFSFISRKRHGKIVQYIVLILILFRINAASKSFVWCVLVPVIHPFPVKNSGRDEIIVLYLGLDKANSSLPKQICFKRCIFSLNSPNPTTRIHPNYNNKNKLG
ncbi:MAG: hypothetical protein ACI4CC_04535, partial [Lachnospiraceae bacterium]